MLLLARPVSRVGSGGPQPLPYQVGLSLEVDSRFSLFLGGRLSWRWLRASLRRFGGKIETVISSSRGPDEYNTPLQCGTAFEGVSSPAFPTRDLGCILFASEDCDITLLGCDYIPRKNLVLHPGHCTVASRQGRASAVTLLEPLL